VRLAASTQEATMSVKQPWELKWKHWIAPDPALPGVWARKEGGWLIRGRAIDPRTGSLREVRRAVMDGSAAEAKVELERELDRIRAGVPEHVPSRTRFAEFAASLLESKVLEGDIKSKAGREKWAWSLTQQLVPAFGPMFVDRVQHADVKAWKLDMAAKIKAGTMSPNTANTHLGILRVITKAAVAELGLERDPCAGIANFDTSDHPTYTDEEPNSLTPEETGVFIELMKDLEPEHYAMTVLGFVTGLRPSSLRPLRRSGPTPDVLWTANAILVRRSNSRTEEIMDRTKTGASQRIELPAEVMDILRRHVEALPDGPMSESEYLFPAVTGGMRSRSVLDKPFATVAAAMDLPKKVTPRAMRRTFNDLAREAEIKDVVTRAISGHQTEAMQRRYSTVRGNEMRGAIAKVIDLAGVKAARSSGGTSGGNAEPATPASEAAGS
jgi:integrase